MKQYTLEIILPGGFMVNELLELCQLIYRRYPTTSLEFSRGEEGFIIQIPQSNLLDPEWTEIDTNFFNGLIQLGLLDSWSSDDIPS